MTVARRIALVSAVALLAASCTPEPATVEGAQVGDLYRFFFYAAVVVFVIVAGLIGWSIIRYRDRRTDDELPPQVHTNVPLEVVWFAIPTVIVIVLFIMSAGVLGEVNEEESDTALSVDVTAFQWGWRFEYPDGRSIDSLPDDPAEIVLPVDRGITFRLNSRDVVHSFWIPRFLLKRDVVPGRENRIDLTIDEEGTYGGRCAEFCGLLHDQMDFTIRAVDEDEYEEWLSTLDTEGSDGG